MKFTRLRLSGFKSFVDPTELLIEPGLTGVVGPNGCGKWNLLEAMRWVMGENRPTSMRGSGMERNVARSLPSRVVSRSRVACLRFGRAQRRAAGLLDSGEIELPVVLTVPVRTMWYR